MVIDTVAKLFNLGMDRELLDPLPLVGPVILNVGAGNKLIPCSIPLDWPEWNADTMDIPYRDGTVDGIHCYHFLEHCARPHYVLGEFQRILKVGGRVNIVVPYYNSQMQAQDLDHKARYCEMTWKTLFNNPYYNKNGVQWKFVVRTNVVMGIVERNMCLVTQLVRIR